MGKRMTTEDQLAMLRRLRAEDRSAAGVEGLRGMLTFSRVHGMVVRGAAELAERWGAKELVGELVVAAESLAGAGEEGQKRDPGCEGKEAVLRVLVGWEAEVPELFEKASRWRQRAPVHGGSVDVAGECRGLAGVGIALTRAGGAEAAVGRIVELLVDEMAATRVRAAQAMGLWRGPEAVPVLRLKALVGDESAEVMGEVLMGLLRQDMRGQLGFVERFLGDEEKSVVEAAAMALGECRAGEALGALAAAWEKLGRDLVRTSVMMAIGLLRTEESVAWLLEKVRTGREMAAIEAVEALRIYRGDGKVAGRVKEAAEGRGEVEKVCGEVFG